MKELEEYLLKTLQEQGDIVTPTGATIVDFNIEVVNDVMISVKVEMADVEGFRCSDTFTIHKEHGLCKDCGTCTYDHITTGTAEHICELLYKKLTGGISTTKMLSMYADGIYSGDNLIDIDTMIGKVVRLMDYRNDLTDNYFHILKWNENYRQYWGVHLSPHTIMETTSDLVEGLISPQQIGPIIAVINANKVLDLIEGKIIVNHRLRYATERILESGSVQVTPEDIGLDGE